MSFEQYIGIGCITIICYFGCLLFAYGGIVKYKLFVRLWQSSGKWKRNWLLIMVITIGVSIYGIWLYGFSREYVSLMLLATYLGAVTVTDLRSREVPDDATIFFSVLFSLWNCTSCNITLIVNGFLGAIVGAAIPFFIYFFKPGSIGFGDIKLLACTGLLTGIPGILFVLLRAMIFGAIFSIGLLLLKKGTLKTELPFAPFVLLAALI